MPIVYYILEFAILYLAIAGTWEIAQATVARGVLSDVQRKIETEETYNPLRTLNPLSVGRMLSWWFCWKSRECGVSDMVILKKRFSWGLRYLMSSIVLMYVLEKVKFLFFNQA